MIVLESDQFGDPWDRDGDRSAGHSEFLIDPGILLAYNLECDLHSIKSLGFDLIGDESRSRVHPRSIAKGLEDHRTRNRATDGPPLVSVLILDDMRYPLRSRTR